GGRRPLLFLLQGKNGGVATGPARRHQARARIVMRPANRLAAHDRLIVLRLQRVAGGGEGVRRRRDVEQKRTRNIRIVGRGILQGTAVLYGYRTGRTGKIDRLRDIEGRRVLGAETADPLAILVVLVVERSVVTAGHDRQRALLEPAVVDVGTDRARAVIGMRPETDVLVPFHLVAAAGP